MGRLFLLRHARAAWPRPGMKDFDRPLEQAGRQDAAALGRMMRVAGLVPAAVLCSTARRARETWACLAETLGMDPAAAQFTDDLYSTDASGYADIVRRAADGTPLLLIGHNPMMEDLALALDGDRDSIRQLGSGFATCALAVFTFEDGLASVAPGAGRLEAYVTPTDL